MRYCYGQVSGHQCGGADLPVPDGAAAVSDGMGHYPAAAVSVPPALPVSGPNQKEKEEALPGRDRGGRGVTRFCRLAPGSCRNFV